MIRILLLLISLQCGAQVREDVRAYLVEIGVKHVDIVLAQAILESAEFTSQRAREDHNIFGMKHPVKRPTKSIGVSRGHAKYRSWKDSCYDYLLWQQMHKKANTREKYWKLLAAKYSTDPLYIQKLKQIMRKL